MKENFINFSIQKRFGGFNLVCSASFSQGVTAIFGPSGSGKTTLLNCLAGMIQPDEGCITLDGRTLFSSLGNTNIRLEKRRVGYVFQDSALFPHMNVRDNIRYGYNLVPTRFRDIDLNHLINLLGLSELLERSVNNLSGGEKQRVALARALAISPKLLLMDEPLASLDARFVGTIIAYLKRIVHDLKIPMVYVSHSLSEVIALADNTLVLEAGRKVAFGSTKILMGNGDLIATTKYSILENILEAQVLNPNEGNNMSVVRIGDVKMFAPMCKVNPGEIVMLGIRAGDIIISKDLPPKTSARNVVGATVTDFQESANKILVFTDVGVRIMVEITHNALCELSIGKGSKVYLIIKTNSMHVMGGNID